MSQIYVLPALTDSVNVAIADRMTSCLQALRTAFSGATAPSGPLPYQFWMDTTTNTLKMRNAANSAWLVVQNMDGEGVVQLHGDWSGDISSTTTKLHAIVPRAGNLKALRVASATATTSSSGNEWQFGVTRYRAGSGIACISAAVGTFTTLSGVGGGTDFGVKTVVTFTPNQNLALLASDLLEVTITKVGTVGNITDIRLAVEMQ